MLEDGKGRKVLWLGAHKTGTTYLQSLLDVSKEGLSEHGVAYENLDTFRNRFTRPLLYKNFTAPPDDRSTFSTGDKATVLFDENIPGLVQSAISLSGGLYPLMEPRVNKVLGYLNYDPSHIVIGIRGMTGFLPSLYCETLKSTPYKSFEEFLRKVPSNISWVPLLKRIVGMFPGRSVTVYKAEEIRGKERELLSMVTGVPAQKILQSSGQERSGFSQKAIDVLDELSRTRAVVRSDVHAIVMKYPKSKVNAGFSPFDLEEKERLDALYARDVRGIKALEYVNFWESSLDRPNSVRSG